MAIISYKCPNCGGDLRFDPQSQQYKCEYCISFFGEDDLASQEKPKEETITDGKSEGQAVAYTCPSCGAEIVTEETTTASFCYYCHNPVVLEGRLEGEYLPNKVIPFKVTKEEALQQFLTYVKKKKFIPNAFFNKDQIEKMSGVYFPYWLNEREVYGELYASATNVRVWQRGDIEYTETKYYDIERAGNIEIGEIIRNGLKKANKTLIEGVQPFPMNECREFSMGYLSGFMAEKWDIKKEEYAAEIEREVNGYVKKQLRGTINGYSSVNTKNTKFQTKRDTWDYILLPVWTLTYKGRDGKVYYYTMNGATKKVCGKLPIDYKKIGMLFAAVFFPVLLIFLIGGYLV